MRYLEKTLSSLEANLALDEALLDEAEDSSSATETLRIWEPTCLGVVVGRSSCIPAEVHVDACRRQAIPIARRTSGGAAVVIGPGCLMYAVVLSLVERPVLRRVAQAHRFVLNTVAEALRPWVPEVCCAGTSDLVLANRKFSGNSLRIRRRHLLYHGTLLYAFPLEPIDGLLAMPPRQPLYREGRSHSAFLTNLPLGPDVLRNVLVTAWNAVEPCVDWPWQRTARLVAERYRQDANSACDELPRETARRGL